VISLQTKKLTKKTAGHCDIIDITPRIHDAIKKDHSHHGLITVFVSRSTAPLTTIEHESGLIQDLKEFVERLIPSDRRYHHDDRWATTTVFSRLRAGSSGRPSRYPSTRQSLSGNLAASDFARFR